MSHNKYNNLIDLLKAHAETSIHYQNNIIKIVIVESCFIHLIQII